MTILEQKNHKIQTNNKQREREKNYRPPLAFFVGRVIDVFFPNAIEHQSRKRSKKSYETNNNKQSNQTKP